MEQTLILIKPDAMEKHVVGKIIDRFEQEGFRIAGLKQVKLTQDILDTWYAHHKDKPFFPELCVYMMSTPVVALVLEADNAVERVREIIGPTDSSKAGPDTIRGQFGEGIKKNVVHASDAPERAQFEKNLLFTPNEAF